MDFNRLYAIIFLGIFWLSKYYNKYENYPITCVFGKNLSSDENNANTSIEISNILLQKWDDNSDDSIDKRKCPRLSFR